MSEVLNTLANVTIELDSTNTYGFCTSQYLNYDEQDCFNAALVFGHVMFSYGIHNGHINDSNVTDIGIALRELCRACGIDTYQESSVKKMLNSI